VLRKKINLLYFAETPGPAFQRFVVIWKKFRWMESYTGASVLHFWSYFYLCNDLELWSKSTIIATNFGFQCIIVTCLFAI